MGKGKNSFEMMIVEHRVNKVLVIIVLFLSLGFSSFYTVRGTFALLAPALGVLANDITAFVFATLINGAVHEFVIHFLFVLFGRRLSVDLKKMQYTLYFFLIPAYFLSGAVKILYFFFPYLLIYGEILINFVLEAIFVSLYTAFCCKHYFRKQDYHLVTKTVVGVFLALCAVSAVFAVMTGVLSL